MKATKRKKLAIKLIPVLILFGGFLFYLNWSQNSEPTFKINENFNELQSESEVFKQISQGLTGSYIPSEYNLFLDVELEKLLVEERRTLKIEKVWSQYDFLFLIYSIDVLQEDQRNEDLPQFTFDELSLHSGDNTISIEVNSTSVMRPNEISKDYVYKHRMYRGIAVNMAGSEKAYDDLQQVYQWDNIDQITVKRPKMLYDSSKGQAFESFSFETSLNLQYNQTLEVFDLNKTTNMDNNLQLTWKKLEMKMDRLTLTFQLEKTDEPLQGITLATATKGKVMTEQYHPVVKKDDHYELSLPTFESTPDTFQVQVRALDFIDRSEPLSYTISNEMIMEGLSLSKGQKVDVLKELGTRNGMTISYAGLSNALPGYEVDEGPSDVLGIVIQLEDIPGERFRMWFNTVTKEMQNLKYNKTESPSDSGAYPNAGPLIEISNDKGELAEAYGSSSETMPDKESQAFHVRKEFFERSDEIIVKLSQFPIHEKVKANKSTFNLR
ncbi:hypothetical protein JI666_10385 [Bacillus sp. NTK071]|uniref:hypothetical protein n=1 Tax=Bacillus sp. NTK071 TaxID=2802175 RepID=UPI001A8FB547|nr:hypothetical protein [Bacillus sp. NTK071]MBN8209151.1 hypothetical protein [Bacillus sp. NTK071]